jgi:hypothetical protein
MRAPRRTAVEKDEKGSSHACASEANDKQSHAEVFQDYQQEVQGFTDEERDAMKERGQELKAEARRGARASKEDGERGDCEDRRDEGTDRTMAKRLHAINQGQRTVPVAEDLVRDARDAKDGKVVCYFTSAQKFNSRYATFGFSDEANLGEGAMWPTSFALTELIAASENRITAHVKKVS